MHLKLLVKCIHFVNQTGHQLSVGELCIFVWAGRYIECDDHAHLVSKPVPWLAVNLIFHYLLSDGAAFNTQSHSSWTS